LIDTYLRNLMHNQDRSLIRR